MAKRGNGKAKLRSNVSKFLATHESNGSIHMPTYEPRPGPPPFWWQIPPPPPQRL